jgi:uncharacterized sporulation protein YeaH/YhbH (DUF444 family)
MDIVRGKIREDLKRFMASDGFWANSGGGPVKIHLKGIEIPHIVYGNECEGVGQGEGEVGDVVGEDAPPGPGEGGGGDSLGEHHLEIEMDFDDIMELVAEDLDLPRMEPKGKKTITVPYGAYTGVRPVGPESLRIFKRSYTRALKRSIAAGLYHPDRPKVLIEPVDKRYRAQKNAIKPFSSAVLLLLRDYSGSMDDNFNHVVRVVSRLFDYWVHHHYNGEVQVRYFMHDTEPIEVDQAMFYGKTSGGGTKFSPVYQYVSDVIDRDHPVALWNNYVVHFTDGDLWKEDTDPAKGALNMLIQKTNLTTYFEVGPLELTYGLFNFTYTRKREDLFGDKIRELIEECKPLFQLAYVETPEDAYDKFKAVLV